MTGFDEIIHQPVRLRIMAALHALEPNAEIEFTALRDLLRVSDGNLATHLRKLEASGYIVSRKTFVGRKPKTYIAITTQGRAAFEAHVEALHQIIGQGAA